MSYTRFHIKGEWKTSSTYCPTVDKGEDGSMVIRAATDGEVDKFDLGDTEPVYNGTFQVEKIAGFIKPLQCRMIVAKMKQNEPPCSISHWQNVN